MSRNNETVKSESILLACQCEHAYQDAKHGQGKRVHNRKADVANAPNYRCTICAKERGRQG